MKKHHILLITTLPMLAFLWLQFSVRPAAAQSGTSRATTSVAATPSTSDTIGLNQQISVTLDVSNTAYAIHGFEFTLSYDATILQFDSATISDWLASTGRSAACSSIATDSSVPTATTISMACATADNSCTTRDAGPMGDGSLATLVFTGLSAGTSDFTISDFELRGAAEIVIADIISSSATVQSPTAVGSLTEQAQTQSQPVWLIALAALAVGLTIYALINRRTTLIVLLVLIGGGISMWLIPTSTRAQSIGELESVAAIWGCASGDSCYNASYDADSNDLIDLADMMSVANATCAVATEWTGEWLLNDTNEESVVFDNIEVNVQSVYTTTIDGADYQCITSAGIPNYSTVIDQSIIDGLANRPKANEFNGSSTPNVSIGDVVEFGESVGYTPGGGCVDVDGGYGYWPGGPACPSDQAKDWCFPLDPEPVAEGELCEAGLNQIGVWINGVSSFNWQDGQSYNNAGDWVNNAFAFEFYDLDICVGHSANGNYHHHSNPTCLGAQLEDSGSAASPIYGFGADGYPIYGPWESAGVLAQSCWKTRDYSATSSTGCGVDGERSCVLVDIYDISQGVEDAPTDGPTTSDYITSMSGNEILAESGAYFQDYYYDPACTAQGAQYLDQHNGHENDELGYHYHTTLTDLGNGEYDYAFPHYNGVTHAGVLHDNAIATCSTDGGGGGPGGGGPGGGGPPGGGGGPP